MAASTTLLGASKPTVGGDADVWGGFWNNNADLWDLLMTMVTPVGHRLTLTTAVPVTPSDVTAASTVYCTPDKHAGILNFNGTVWTITQQSELSLAFSSNSGHTNYHQSGKNFDVWYFDDSGTKRIGTGAAWTNDTTRADALVRLNGVYVNNATISNMRFGSASGNTVSVSANRATYLGTIRMTADGQCEDSLAKRFVWNAYNRRARPMRVIEGTDSWAYTTATIRQANNSAANQLAFVRGLNEDAVRADVQAVAANSSAGPAFYASIGLDSTSASSASTKWPVVNAPASNANCTLAPSYDGLPGLGYHYLAWLEYSQASGTTTWLGDAGGTLVQSGISGTVFA